MHFNRLRHCLHFSSLAYYYTHRSRGRINAKVKIADQVEQSVQFFSSLLEGNISHQKLRNCCVAKQLMTHTFSAKFRVFRKEFLRNRSVYWAQIFRDDWNCHALSIFRVFILLTTPENTITLFVCHLKILHKHCLQFLLGVEKSPRETENNAYAKFWGNKQVVLWYAMVFSGVVNRAFARWRHLTTTTRILLGFRFLVQITPFVLDTPLGLQNLNKKRKTKWILVDVVK